MPFSLSAAFSYPNFPFGFNFPLTSTSFSSNYTPLYIDSSCFQAIPSQLMVPSGTVSPHYAWPAFMESLPEGSMISGSDRNRWGEGGGQGLVLNSGTGIIAAAYMKFDIRAKQHFPIDSSPTFKEQARCIRCRVPRGRGRIKKETPGMSGITCNLHGRFIYIALYSETGEPWLIKLY